MPSPRPKILLLLHELSRSGAPKLALDIFAELGDEFEVRIVSLVPGALAARARQIAPLAILLPTVPSRASSFKEQVGYGVKRIAAELRGRRERRNLARWQPDLVYANTVETLPLVDKLGLKAPLLLHVHELESHLEPAFRRQPKMLQERPAHYLACSEAVARTLAQKYAVDPAKITVVHSFIPTGMSHPKKAAPDGPFTIGNAGAPAWRKGVELWLLAAAEVLQKIPTARFQWVGWQDDERGLQCKEMASRLGISQSVEWIPATPDPLPHYARCHLMCVSSWEEPASLVALEAMSLQVPVVCFQAGGGPAELVGETGLVLQDLSPSAMAGAILKLLAEPEERDRLGALARQRVQDLFTAGVQIPKIAAAIRQTISSSL